MKPVLSLPILLLALAILALPVAAAVPGNPYRGTASSPVDIDVTYLSQDPRYAFDAAKNNPAVGDPVTFTAHVRNRGTASGTGSYAYQWYVDGASVSSGAAQTIPGHGDVKIRYTWTWQDGDHDISFFADPVNAITEKSEQNNLRTIRTTGLRVGFWVEESVYRFFNENQYAFTQRYGITDEANSWEDWAQRQIDLANRLQSEAVYPSTPTGCRDRWRLDQVIVVPDDALPLNGGLASNHPDTRDRTVDMMWGFEQDILPTNFYRTTDNSDNPFNQEISLLHEMFHARYLEDAYALDIHGHSMGVLDDRGARIYPGGGEMVHVNSDTPSIMNSNPWISEWEAAALNLWAGKRPQPGWANYNAHAGIGWFLANHMPAQNYLRVVDSDGDPVEGATVQVYQAGGVPARSTDRNIIEAAKDFYPKYIDNTIDAQGTTDPNGLYSLGANPFSVTEPIGDSGFPRCVDFVKVRYGGNVTLFWLDLPMVQTQYFRGNTASARYEVRLPVKVSPPQKVTFSGKVTDTTTGVGLSLIPVYFWRQDGGDSFSIVTGPFGIYSAQLDQSTDTARGYTLMTNTDNGDRSRPKNPAYGSAQLTGIQPDQNRANLDLALVPGTPTQTPTPTPTPGPGSGTLVETTESSTSSTYLGYSAIYYQQAQSLKAAGSGVSQVSVALARKGTPTRNIRVSIRSAIGGTELATATITPSLVTSPDPTKPTWVTVPVTRSQDIARGSTVYLVLKMDGYDSRNYYLLPLNKNNEYRDGSHFQNTRGSLNAGSDMLVRAWFTG